MPQPRKPEPTKYCLFCKKRLHRRTYTGRLEDLAVFSRRKYCDVLCMAKGMVRQQVTRSGWMQRAKKFRGKKCETCGTTKHLNVHHKNEDYTDNAPANLMTLCASCHLKLHWANGKTMPRRPRIFCTVCGKKAEGRGFCMNHYRHYMKYGDPLLTKKSGRSDGTILNETKTASNG